MRLAFEFSHHMLGLHAHQNLVKSQYLLYVIEVLVVMQMVEGPRMPESRGLRPLMGSGLMQREFGQ